MEIKRQDCVVKKTIQAQKYLPAPHKHQMVAPLALLGRCPVFETKARINVLIPFEAISRSKSIDLKQ